MLSLITRPPGPFLTAAWRWLSVFNFEIDPERLAPYVPRGTELDFDPQGKTYISLVGFVFEETRLLGWSIPWHRNFEELNLRFYVRHQAEDETRRGVVFLKELVSRVAISTVARWGYNENYFTVPMRHQITPGDPRSGQPLTTSYEFYHSRRWNHLRATCSHPATLPTDDSHEAFILEHYWGYCRQRDDSTIEYRVEHPRWQVRPTDSIDLAGDFAAVYGETFAPVLAAPPVSSFVADGSLVSVSRPRRLCDR
ncbi:MAG TPA: DUF2071 domain-containing protein [Pirellulaceae bacterium]|nr:DUF2071 domain-containing protein [Pirellulaceae bacterium]